MWNLVATIYSNCMQLKYQNTCQIMYHYIFEQQSYNFAAWLKLRVHKITIDLVWGEEAETIIFVRVGKTKKVEEFSSSHKCVADIYATWYRNWLVGRQSHDWLFLYKSIAYLTGISLAFRGASGACSVAVCYEIGPLRYFGYTQQTISHRRCTRPNIMSAWRSWRKKIQ